MAEPEIIEVVAEKSVKEKNEQPAPAARVAPRTKPYYKPVREVRTEQRPMTKYAGWSASLQKMFDEMGTEKAKRISVIIDNILYHFNADSMPLAGQVNALMMEVGEKNSAEIFALIITHMSKANDKANHVLKLHPIKVVTQVLGDAARVKYPVVGSPKKP